MRQKSISNLINTWRSLKYTRKRKSMTTNSEKVVSKEAILFKGELSANPYANIIASPLRQCAFYGRTLPSGCLLRFGTAWHPQIKSIWTFSSVKETSGCGHYVTLQKKLLDIIQKRGNQSIFRRAIGYRSDMNKHVEHLLMKQSWLEFLKLSIDKFDLLLPSKKKYVWEPRSQTPSSGYHCILIFDLQPSDSKVCVNSEVKNQKYIPSYNMNNFWSKELVDDLKEKFHVDSLALGVPKCAETVELAKILWRCKQFIK